MAKLLIIFPHQLFKSFDAFDYDQIVLIEHPLYFGTDHKYPIKFHKQKLVLHRASMKAFAAELENVRYINFADCPEDMSDLFKSDDELTYYDVVDFELRKRLENLPQKTTELPSPNFYLERGELPKYFNEKKQYFTKFYKRRRKELSILMNDDEPQGGQWTYDQDNRKKLPKKHFVPEVKALNHNGCVEQSIEYIENHFPDNYGSLENFIYPTNHEEASEWLDDFINNRLVEFGPYEDAIEPGHDFLFHSVLTPALNIGLLNPRQIIDKVIVVYEAGDAPIESVEGFIRQIIGWREFMRGLYEVQGVSMRTSNYFEFENKLGEQWYSGKTGIEPLDIVIKKIDRLAYAHHIERLMIAGNLMLLMNIHPKQSYTWFMELFIDAYDWVMVPNVYGMSQFADGGKIVTKPYISGSNYIKKMSSYGKAGWNTAWDGLYWLFIEEHRELFKNNQRMSMMVSMLDKKTDEQKNELFDTAREFITKNTI